MIRKLLLALAFCFLSLPAFADFDNPQGQVQSFVPTFTAATPGDLSVAYTTQTGSWSQTGKRVEFIINMIFTPTFTTASGNLRFVLTGLPAAASGQNFPVVPTNLTVGWTWPASRTMVIGRVLASSNTIELLGLGSAAAVTAFAPSNIVSGVSLTVNMSGWYYIP